MLVYTLSLNAFTMGTAGGAFHALAVFLGAMRTILFFTAVGKCCRACQQKGCGSQKEYLLHIKWSLLN